MQITGALVKFLVCHSLLLSLDEELADLSLPLAFSPHPYFLFQEVSQEIFRRTRPMSISVSDASLIIADNCNALGLILPPSGRSISALFDLLCKLRGTLCYSV